MNRTLTFAPAVPVPATASVEHPSDEAEEWQTLLRTLIDEESALYAVTRNGRYDTAGLKFARLHEVLNEQLSEIGRRLLRLAERGRTLGCWDCSSLGERSSENRVTKGKGGLESRIIEELLARHTALIALLRLGLAPTIGTRADVQTARLFTELLADHERDAFILRAVRWEVQNPS